MHGHIFAMPPITENNHDNMSKLSTSLRYLLLFLLLASGHLAKANTYFDDNRVTITYDYLKGIVKIDYMYLDEDGIDDSMDRASLWYKDPSTGREIPLFDHGYADLQWFTTSVNTDVVGTGGYGAGNDLSYVGFQWNNIPTYLLGKKIDLIFRCNWDIDSNNSRFDPYTFATTRSLDFTTISPPSSIKVSQDQCNKVVVTWAASELKGAPDGNLKYYVYRYDGGLNLTPNGLDKSTKTFTDETVVDGKPYRYQVIAILILGKTQHYAYPGLFDGKSLPQPALPALSIGQDACAQSVKLSWTQLTVGVDKFILERSTTSNFASKVQLVNDATTYAYEDKPASGVTYYYRLTVQNSCKEGPAPIVTSIKPDYKLSDLVIAKQPFAITLTTSVLFID